MQNKYFFTKMQQFISELFWAFAGKPFEIYTTNVMEDKIRCEVEKLYPDFYLNARIVAEAGKLPQQGNFWYGTTVTRPDQQYAWFEPGTYNWFLSIEPIQEDFGTFGAAGEAAPPWIIVGAETGQQKNKTIPQAEWVQHILEFSQAHGSKVFLKNNLAPYFAGDLVQDFPFSYPTKNLG